MIIVVDKLSSGLGIAAQARAQIFNNVEVVSVFDFSSPKKLILYLLSREDEIVLFSWRGSLSEIILGIHPQDLESLLTNKTIGVSVADHIGVDSKDVPVYEKWMGIVDFICVTNSYLLQFYGQANCRQLPVFLLKDLPNVSLINQINRVDFSKREIDIIWVGNSAWGARQGYTDHKGLKSRFLPAIDILLRNRPGTSIKIIDSAKKSWSHMEVLQALANSKVLVQTSGHEGTGLPVLEALMLGCNVVSTPVGIVRTLPTQNSLIITDFKPKQIAEDIIKALSTPNTARNLDAYISDSDIFLNCIEKVPNPATQTSSPKLFLIIFFRLKWIFRYFNNKIRWRQ